MQHEAVKPNEGVFPALRYTLTPYAYGCLIAASPHSRTIHETDTCAFAKQILLDKDNELLHNGFFQFCQLVV